MIAFLPFKTMRGDETSDVRIMLSQRSINGPKVWRELVLR